MTHTASTLRRKMTTGYWGPIETVSERTSVRHGLADELELGMASDAWDNISHPVRNWGYEDNLDWRLKNLDRIAKIKTGRVA